MRNLKLFVALIALLGVRVAVAGDSAAAPEKAALCAACHGADGKAMIPIYPHLAGQYSTYIEQALREYRAGARKNPVMTPQAATLTDAEIRQLAAYYSALPGPLHTPEIHTAAPKK
ncbi:MAG: c-type cytochrome [Nevskiaceae bacterium]